MIPESPITREEMYLAAIASEQTSGLPTPITREEQYLNAIAKGDTSGIPSAPLTRTEQYLDYIAKNGGGGSSAVISNDNIAINWEFSDAINTPGQSSYQGSSFATNTFDGWKIQSGKVTLVDGGITLARNDESTWGFFMQRFSANTWSKFIGSKFTFSAIVNGELGSATEVIGSASNTSYCGFDCGGLYFRVYSRGNGGTGDLTIDIPESSVAEGKIVSAIKIEAGETQTLAHKVGDIWVLNKHMEAIPEKIKLASNMLS